MYSKEELQAKSVVQLKDIVKEIGAKIKSGDNKETIIYTILDKQAETSAQPAAKRKRTRIAAKKEDRVYSVNGIEGENFDVQKPQGLQVPWQCPSTERHSLLVILLCYTYIIYCILMIFFLKCRVSEWKHGID